MTCCVGKHRKGGVCAYVAKIDKMSIVVSLFEKQSNRVVLIVYG